jgi:hypothetical protein
MPTRARPIAAVLLALVALTGCGSGGRGSGADSGAGSADSAAVLKLFTGYDAALIRGDYATACDLLTTSVQREVVATAASLGGRTCAAAMGRALGTLTPAVRRLVVDSLGAARISNVRIVGDHATALLSITINARTTTKTYLATREGGRWKVDQSPTAA